jgi:dTDP-4-amino-4,6-dideoxygalactose transaminase
MNFYQKKYEIDPQSIRNSIEWGNETISLPFYPSLTKDEQEYVLKVLLEEVQPMIERV